MPGSASVRWRLPAASAASPAALAIWLRHSCPHVLHCHQSWRLVRAARPQGSMPRLTVGWRSVLAGGKQPPRTRRIEWLHRRSTGARAPCLLPRLRRRKQARRILARAAAKQWPLRPQAEWLLPRRSCLQACRIPATNGQTRNPRIGGAPSSGPPGASGPQSGSGPGRSDRFVSAVLDGLRERDGGRLFLVAEPGIGESRLAHDAVVEARGRGLRRDA